MHSRILIILLISQLCLLSKEYILTYKAVVKNSTLYNEKITLSIAMIQNRCLNKNYLGRFEGSLNSNKINIADKILEKKANIKSFSNTRSNMQTFDQTTLLIPPTLLDIRKVSQNFIVYICE